MPKFTVFYVALNDEQVAIVNDPFNGGWSCKVGKAYLDATFAGERGCTYKGAVKYGLIHKAAVLEARSLENVFGMMQNLTRSWAESPDIKCLTEFPRSMSIGDIVYLHDTKQYAYCARAGFTALETREIVDHLNKLLEG